MLHSSTVGHLCVYAERCVCDAVGYSTGYSVLLLHIAPFYVLCRQQDYCIYSTVVYSLLCILCIYCR